LSANLGIASDTYGFPLSVSAEIWLDRLDNLRS